MMVRCVLLLLLVLPGLALADANSGEFMGYQLGGKYPRTAATPTTTTTRGNLLIVAERPVKPVDIDEVTVIATVESGTIGHVNAASWYETEAAAREVARNYVRILRAKYPEWIFGDERMGNDLRIIEVNFDRSPYNLRLRLLRDDSNAEKPWRFSMSLSWNPGSPEGSQWRVLARSELEAAQVETREKILEKSDTRGL